MLGTYYKGILSYVRWMNFEFFIFNDSKLLFNHFFVLLSADSALDISILCVFWKERKKITCKLMCGRKIVKLLLLKRTRSMGFY